MQAGKEENPKEIVQSLKQKNRKLMDKIFLEKMNAGIGIFSQFLSAMWEADKKVLADYLKSDKTKEIIEKNPEAVNPRITIMINKYSRLDEKDSRGRKQDI